MNYLGLIISLVCFIPAVICHEVAHGWVANKLGDPTAKALGRLTLNPLKHIDPFGSVIVPIGLALLGGPIFGWAKPVPYNPNNFGKDAKSPQERVKALKQGELLVGLAGPATNIALAVVGAILYQIAKLTLTMANPVGYAIMLIASTFVVVNLVLAFFNLIPLPPLDGSSIIAVFLPPKAMQYYYKIQQYSLPILIGLMVVVPMLFNVDPLNWYFAHTADAVASLLLF